MMKKLLIAITTFFIGVLATYSQDKKKWNVNNPDSLFKEVQFTVDEGTWMNLDVSPDGKQIVFDLLGDLYTIPIGGGKATVLRSGHAYTIQPKYSPDGKHILFTSDEGGGDNIWLMKANGDSAKALTTEDFRMVNNAVFTPDGQYIIAKKNMTSTRSGGAGELWMYHIGGGKGLVLVPKKNEQQDINEPVVSPDGRYVYYAEDMYPGGFFQYNKDPNSQIFAIKKLDRQKGTTETVTGGPGGAFRPVLSRSGKLMAFVKRVRTKTVLYLRQLDTGEEWPIYDQLSKDQQEAWTMHGIYTRFAFTPNDEHIIIWANGKINKVELSGINKAANIPFTANVKQRIDDVVRFQQKISPDNFTAKVIRHAITSPDGKWLVFNAVGYLWKKALPDGKPIRLTTGKDFEFEPSFSKDGKTLAYTTWSDETTGGLQVMDFANGTTKKISTEKGIYRNPAFSPDGSKIVYQKEGGNDDQGNNFSVKPGVYLIASAGGLASFVSEKGENPVFNQTGDRIYYQTGGQLFGSLKKTMGSYNLDGNDDRTLINSTYANQFTVSPDEKWVAFVDLHKVYIAAFPQLGKPLELGSGSTGFPVKQVSKDAGINLHWHANGQQLHYTLGPEYFTINLADRFEFVAGKPDSLFLLPEQGIAVNLQVKTNKPTGVIAFTNARIITMKGNEVIENGTLIVEGNRIKAVGANLTIPAGAKQIDVAGKTIMPGIVDAHAHGNHFRYGQTPQKSWPYYANLAYGVTTMHDPSANSEMVFAQSELVQAGEMVGPRVFSTGTILYGADGDFKAVINNYEDARSALKRSKAYGAFSVKSYNQPKREQRQMVIKAARELEMEVVPEGGSTFYHNLTMINDGHTTIEHNLPVANLYSDIVQLWKNAGTAYTPTLIVCYGAPSGEYYWYQHTNVWEKERLLRFTPRGLIDSRSRFRTMLPEEEYENGHILTAKSCKKLIDAGVKVNMGAHGQIQGLGAHWETWMLAQGGFTPLEALQAATLTGAQSLGLDQSIGSLEAGKLADLLVLDKNPLDDIRNTEFIKYTMVNGRLYDAETMHETGNQTKAPTKFWWEHPKSTQLGWHEETNSFSRPGCLCGKH